MNSETKETKIDLKNIINNIDYKKLYGRGGSFIITPLDQGTIFTREMLPMKC